MSSDGRADPLAVPTTEHLRKRRRRAEKATPARPQPSGHRRPCPGRATCAVEHLRRAASRLTSAPTTTPGALAAYRHRQADLFAGGRRTHRTTSRLTPLVSCALPPVPRPKPRFVGVDARHARADRLVVGVVERPDRLSRPSPVHADQSGSRRAALSGAPSVLSPPSLARHNTHMKIPPFGSPT